MVFLHWLWTHCISGFLLFFVIPYIGVWFNCSGGWCLFLIAQLFKILRYLFLIVQLFTLSSLGETAVHYFIIFYCFWQGEESNGDRISRIEAFRKARMKKNGEPINEQTSGIFVSSKPCYNFVYCLYPMLLIFLTCNYISM